MVHVAYIAPDIGSVTSTFVYREILALRTKGVRVSVFSTRRPAGQVVSEEALPFTSEAVYLYQSPAKTAARALGCVALFAVKSPVRFLGALGKAIGDALFAEMPGFADRLKVAWHFLVGCVLARDVRKYGAAHIHAHFAHVPTALAMYAAMVSGLSFSFTAHANDIFERGTALKQKVERAAFVACISEYNVRRLAAMGCDERRMCVVHCGLDVADYGFAARGETGNPPAVVSIGRFVEKKGFRVLVEAMAVLKERGPLCDCVIVGDGPLFGEIEAMARDRGMGDIVYLAGAQPHERVRELLERADVFTLPCVVAASGDRDGIPVVLMEAMALGVPVVSTSVSGIPELVESGVNGLLVEPGDAEGLADALERVLRDRALARNLATKARARIENDFNLDSIAEGLRRLYENAIARSSEGAARRRPDGNAT